MFGQLRQQRKVTPASAAVAEAPQLHVVASTAPDQSALLQRWMSLADMQQRIIHTLVSEIKHTSAFVETEADALSGRFQRLAIGAGQQTARVDSLTNLAIGIEVEGKTVPIDEVAKLLDATLSDVVQKILLLSKDSMSMVYALDALNANVGRVDKCMEQLSAITSTTNMLALNARIEAERAGAAGAAFRVVANEVRELSRATQSLAVSMQVELKAVADGITSGHETLKRVATIDMSENIMAKQRLEVLLGALMRRSESLTSIVADAVKEAGVISADVDAMVTGIQFQDRTRQRLEHVVDTLHVIDQALDDIKSSTIASVPGLAANAAPDVEWVKKLLDRFTLSEMRARFVEQLIEGKQPVETQAVPSGMDAPSSSGSIELF
ncbi:methyl-accepting chemotaxis protein [Bradyrhizobium sp.]|uniref:methyl-accepting chemotaxis protein n=1 Tax=Bradyrhizobium sp. TaxID=376 RepID=UPI003C7041DF